MNNSSSPPNHEIENHCFYASSFFMTDSFFSLLTPPSPIENIPFILSKLRAVHFMPRWLCASSFRKAQFRGNEKSLFVNKKIYL
jgi:hypothetical protein